jgi:predicted XRE-type DNA-binding protein
MTTNRQRREHSQVNVESEDWPEKMTVSQARKFLGVSESKISNLLSTGILPFERDYLDNRVKLVKKSDLEALLEKRKQG